MRLLSILEGPHDKCLSTYIIWCISGISYTIWKVSFNKCINYCQTSLSICDVFKSVVKRGVLWVFVVNIQILSCIIIVIWYDIANVSFSQNNTILLYCSYFAPVTKAVMLCSCGQNPQTEKNEIPELKVLFIILIDLFA